MTLTELLESVHRVEVRTNRLVNDTMVGAYLSHFRGRGMDFEGLREYMPGDDVRDIDWNVSNRMGRPFVKRFREERELTMVLALDVSASSAFGSTVRSKREFAAEVAGTLAISAARSSDKIALLLFSDRVELFVPPRKGRRHILRLIREMLFLQPQSRRTRIPAALTFLNHVLHRRSIIFLLTDFLHCFEGAADAGRWSSHFSLPGVEGRAGSPLPAALPPAGSGALGVTRPALTPSENAGSTQRDVIQDIGLTNARHDLVCVHLHDPRESALPPAGLLTIEDAETGELLELNSSSAGVRQQFARTNAARLEELDRALVRAGVDTLRLSTAEPFAEALQSFFELRRGRRRG